jgi:hypothetical protein
MRVFVVGTGRCGTATFYQACRHITNYTCAHESQAFRIPDYEYPDNHIEVSHLNVIAIPWLREHYPGSVFVHLTRERQACIKSLQSEEWGSMYSWCFQWYLSTHAVMVRDAAQAYYDRITELCNALLPPDHLRIRIETAKEQWPQFWNRINAVGNYGASLSKLSRRYNYSQNNRTKDAWK